MRAPVYFKNYGILQDVICVDDLVKITIIRHDKQLVQFFALYDTTVAQEALQLAIGLKTTVVFHFENDQRVFTEARKARPMTFCYY